MKRAALLVLLMFCGTPEAQPAPDKKIETVIVTAPKLTDEVKATIHNFVTTFTVPSPITGAITRWNKGICPATYGFSEHQNNDVVSFRIRQVAAMVGAPVAKPPCKPNIEVYFADQPQHLLDGIREHGGAALLASSPSQAKKLAIFAHPVQAWYVTGTRDNYGHVVSDNEDVGYHTRIIESRARTGLSSELTHIYIVADVNQTHAYSFVGITDYIAMLALSQAQSFDECQPLPSITNLTAPNCSGEKKADAVSETDLAYLKGVYSMDAGGSLTTQQGAIAAEITKALEGR